MLPAKITSLPRPIKALILFFLDGRFDEQLRRRGVREVLIAIPSLKPSRRRQMLEFLSGVSLRVRSVPSLAELIARGGKGIADLADVSVDDLLGRDPVARVR